MFDDESDYQPDWHDEEMEWEGYVDYDYDDWDNDDYGRYGPYFDVNRVQSLLYRIRWWARKLALLWRLKTDKEFRARIDDIPF